MFPDRVPDTFPIQPCAGCPGAGEPIERNIVEHVIAGEGIFRVAAVIRPFKKFLVHPHGQRQRRIVQGIADRLRSRVHLVGIPGHLIQITLNPIQRLLLLLARVRREYLGDDQRQVHVSGQ